MQTLQTKCLAIVGNTNAAYLKNDGVYCYQFVNTQKTWVQAKNDCSQRHGHLLTINSQQTNDFVLNMLSGFGYVNPVWIGFFDRASEETWQWDSGQFDKHISFCLALVFRLCGNVWL